MNDTYEYKYLKYKNKYIVTKIKNSVVLTPDSIAIINYLNQLNFNPYEFTNKPNMQNIHKLANQFQDTYNNINYNNIIQTKNNTDIKTKYFDGHNVFLDDVIKDDVNNIINLSTSCYEYNNQKLIIQTNYQKYPAVIKLLFCLLKMNNYTNDCKLGLYPSVLKKYFPNHNKPITSLNINSGFTLPYDFSIMFRKEEIIKVTIHELLHQIGVNLNVVIDEKSINYFFKYKKNGDILIDEAYVEFNACILNLLYIKTIYNLDNLLLSKLLSYELEFSMLQLAKLLLHFNIDDYNDFYPKCHLLDGSNNNGNNNDKCIFDQIDDKFKVNIQSNCVCANITHPESYIIIKTAMLYYMDETLDVLEQNGKNIFNINGNQMNNNNIINYILDICGRPEFVSTINKMIIVYKKDNNKNNFIKTTCRLTCIETIM